MSRARSFVVINFILALAFWAWGSSGAHAQSPEALSDGAALLQTLDKSNPAHNRLFQEVNKRLPESAKAGNADSPLLMNPSDEHRKFAAGKDSGFIFIKKPDGTVGVADRSRVSKGLTGTVNHLTQHEDFPGLFRENYDRLKAEHDKAIDKVKKKGGIAGAFAGLASFPARDAPASKLRDYAKDAWGAAYSSVMRRIDAASDAVKEEELARIERGDPQPEPKPVETAAEEKAEEETETAEAEEPKAEQADDQKAAELAAIRARATQELETRFNELDRSVAEFEAAANRDLAVCQRAKDALRNGSEIDRLAEEAKRRLAPAKITPATEKIETGPLVDQLKNMLETIRSTNRLSNDAGDNACKVVDGVTAASLGRDADKAGNLAVLADQLSDAARSLAEPTMQRLAKVHVPSTPLKSLAEEFDDKRQEAYRPLQEYCKALESELGPLRTSVLAAGSLNEHWKTRPQGAAMRRALNGARAGMAGFRDFADAPTAESRALDSVTKLTYESRFVHYQNRITNILPRAKACTHYDLQLAAAKCLGAFNLTESGFRDTEEYARTFVEQRKIRQSQLAQIRALLDDIERAAKQARESADKARACVQQAEADGRVPDAQTAAEAAGLADLSAVSCDVAEFDRRISELKAEKFKDVDGIAQHVASLEAKRGIIQAAYSKFEEGRTRFKQGDPSAAAAQLQAARSELAKLNGAPQCPELAGRIDKGEQQSQQLEDILSSASGALNTCKVADIRAALRKIGGKTKPAKLLEMKTQLQQQMSVLALVGKARAAFKAGQYDQALALLREAKAKKRSLGSACPVIDQRIDNATAAVQRRRDEESGSARVADAARTCNMRVLKSFVAGSGGITKALKARADDALQVCQAREEDRQARERADQLAGRRAQCEKDHGAGYYPGEPDANGSFYCLPTQATANRWCNENNPGSGWKAKGITSTGTYDCVQNRRQRVAAARADCRQQARAAGKVYAFTKMKKDGTYNCHWCERGYRYRKGRCHPRNRRTVYTCPKGYYLRGRTCYSRNNGAAAAAAAAAAIGIINSLSRGRRGGGSTNCRVNPMAPNC